MDRQQLDETDAMLRRPIDPFTQRQRVTDAKISVTPRCEGGEEDAGETFSRRMHPAKMSGAGFRVNPENEEVWPSGGLEDRKWRPIGTIFDSREGAKPLSVY